MARNDSISDFSRFMDRPLSADMGRGGSAIGARGRRGHGRGRGRGGGERRVPASSIGPTKVLFGQQSAHTHRQASMVPSGPETVDLQVLTSGKPPIDVEPPSSPRLTVTHPMKLLGNRSTELKNALRDYLGMNKEQLLTERKTGGGPATAGLEKVMSDIGGHLLYAVDEISAALRHIVNLKSKFSMDEATSVTKSLILLKEILQPGCKDESFSFSDASDSTFEKMMQVLSFALVAVTRKLEEMKSNLLDFKSVTQAFQYCAMSVRMFSILSEIDVTKMGKSSDAQLVAERLAHSTSSKPEPDAEDTFSVGFSLMAGEKKLVTALNVRVEEYSNTAIDLVPGVFYVTNYRCVFIADKGKGSNCEFPVHCIRATTKIGSRKRSADDSYGIAIHRKDLQTVRLMFDKDFTKRTKEPIRKLLTTRIREQLSKPLERFFAFQFRPATKFAMNGWAVYEAVSEYRRMGIPNTAWRLTNANSSHEMCATYPRVLAVPTTFPDRDLPAVANFRSRGRLPALSWLNQTNKASLTRCSQPKSGVSRNTCLEDQTLLERIKEATPACARLRIFDARPKVNAVANTAKGAGFEVMGKYKSFSTLSFLGIGNIHVMRDSLNKVADLKSKRDDDKYLVYLSDTGWLQYCKLLLSNTARIVEAIMRYGDSVLIHCSDGWDRTAQLCSLAMIEMDPYYRTIIGFEVLIEKEWLTFGHQFALRHGHDSRDDVDSQRSPIFFQFVFAVYQLLVQFPGAFEFNEDFLLALMHHSHSCLYGTFLCNSQKERSEYHVRSKTVSLWSYLNSQRDFVNPFYKEVTDVLTPVANLTRIHMWEAYLDGSLKGKARVTAGMMADLLRSASGK